MPHGAALEGAPEGSQGAEGSSFHCTPFSAIGISRVHGTIFQNDL